MSKNGDEEAYDMCLALRELREEGRLEGRLEGRENALMMASRVFKTLRSDGDLSDEIIAQRCECDVEDVQAVRKAFGI